MTQAQALEIKEYWEYYRDEAKIRYDKGMESFTAAKDIPLDTKVKSKFLMQEQQFYKWMLEVKGIVQESLVMKTAL